MTLINASILAGVLLAGVPVILHLIMRAKPKRIEFPALRLLQSRQTSNARRMRLRHILLLLLRAIVIAAAVLALARPALPAARYSLRWYEWAVLAAVVLISLGVYRWRSEKVNQREAAEHLRREGRSRLRVYTLLGGLLAVLLCVGLPWGVRVRGEITAPGNPLAADIPVAAVFVFDNSLSMTYKHESLTRLQQAGQMAMNHLSILPQRSRVSVTTLDADAETVFQADLAGARSRIEDLKTTAVPRSLNAVLKNAIEAHVSDRELVQSETGSSDAFAREIYLLTDLSEAAWNDPDESGLRDLLVQYEWLQLYLIDVSVPNPINVSLGQLRFDREATVTGQPINISVAVSATAAGPAEASIELYTLDNDGNEIRGGAGGGNALSKVRFQGSPPVATFSVRGIQGAGFQRGFLRLTSPDPMPVDDIRYFVFGVRPVPRVLLVGDRPIDTWLFRNALQPVEFDALGELRYQCKTVTGADFAREELRSYDIICVLNWTRPDPSVWSGLHRFVSDGGALFVSLGGEKLLQAGDWSTTDAQQLLPGVPLAALPFRPHPGQLNLTAKDNPIVASFLQDQNAVTELSRALFDRSWTVDVAPDARVLMTYNDRTTRPALLERSVGRGRVLMFTSAVDNNGQDKWNEGLVTDEPWAFLMLVDQMMQYLNGTADAKRNFTVGDPVEFAVPQSQRFSQYRVARPRFRLTEGVLPFDEASVLLTDIDEAGHYELRSADEGSSFSSEFAANMIDAESNLTRMTSEKLDQILGPERYSRVTDPEELDRAVNLGRLGVEVFPVLMGLLILLFCAEHLMANFFYDEEPEPVNSRPSAA
ncbi:MAG: VWA domain-containing protein [Fuerstiella sp.]